MKSLCLTDPAFLASNASVTPSSYAGLLRWWDASALAYSDGTAIDNGSNKWTDLSGNAAHANQATGGNQPLCKTGIQNGLRGILFDGVDDELNFTAISSATALTLIAVVKNTANGQGTLGLLKNSGGTGDWRLDLGASLEVKYRITDNGNDTAISNQFTSTASAAHCSAVAVDSAGANNADFYEGATSRGTFTVATFSLSLDKIGAPVGANWTGYLLEIVAYSQKRTSTEIAALYNSYFKPKWGLP